MPYRSCAGAGAAWIIHSMPVRARDGQEQFDQAYRRLLDNLPLPVPPSSTRGEPAMRAALYARVSTERQERFQTIDSQLAALRDWAATGGHEISDDFVFRDEGYSGSRLDPPGLDALRDAVRDGVVEKSSPC